MPQLNPVWERNDLQFPRLLAAIHEADLLDDTAWDILLDAMDLGSEDLTALFERAEAAWSDYKSMMLQDRALTLHSSLTAAFRCVLDLAEQNVVDEMNDWDEHNRQMLAIRTIDTYLRGQGIRL